MSEHRRFSRRCCSIPELSLVRHAAGVSSPRAATRSPTSPHYIDGAHGGAGGARSNIADSALPKGALSPTSVIREILPGRGSKRR
jgi:hypothetical protein